MLKAKAADIPAAFDVDVKNAVLGLREELGGVIAGRVDSPFQPIELHKTFGIDRRLGWTVSRLLQDDDLFEAARHFPGDSAIRRFLKRVGGDKNQASRVLEAAERFQLVIVRHGGDRETFDHLLAAKAGAEQARTKELEQRAAAFSANGYVYGVQARTQLAAYFLSPNGDGRTVDVASVRGFVGLRRLRAGRSWPLSARRWASEDGSANLGASFRPLDPREPHNPDHAPLMRSFCVPENIQLDASEVAPGVREYTLPPSDVGLHHAVTCIIGERIDRAGDRYRTERDPIVALSPGVRTPVEGLLIDCYLHRDLAGFGEPSLELTSDVHRLAGASHHVSDRDRLDPLATVRDLGAATAAAVREPRVEGHEALIESCFRFLDADREMFTLHRAWLPSPPVASTASLVFELPPAPSG